MSLLWAEGRVAIVDHRKRVRKIGYMVNHDRLEPLRLVSWSVDSISCAEEGMQTMWFVTIGPILYEWMRCELWTWNESVNSVPRALHMSIDKACIQIVNKSAKIVQIVVDGWQCQVVCIEAYLECVAENCLPTKPSQVYLNDVSFHALIMSWGEMWFFTHI